jgi:hypothetical protein
MNKSNTRIIRVGQELYILVTNRLVLTIPCKYGELICFVFFVSPQLLPISPTKSGTHAFSQLAALTGSVLILPST